jgi:hypothetical protein
MFTRAYIIPSSSAKMILPEIYISTTQLISVLPQSKDLSALSNPNPKPTTTQNATSSKPTTNQLQHAVRFSLQLLAV